MVRSASIYAAAIDALKVDAKDSKYQPVGGTTYCNVFAQDVMKSSSIATPLPGGTANDMADALYGNGTPGWYSVSFIDAQNRANNGYPTIGILKASGHGHVVVVRPKGTAITQIRDVQVAQAGSKNFNSTTINWSWKASALPDVKFYTHN
ncbi:hypothetical protein ACYCS5_15875 [Paenibacillus sp. SEL3]|uniref:hypothetical protein n=1 Tax=Paenibacillus polymyxa TaxID=1406 RepID=UPI00211DA029|nr:hypothetical protein [Paenibacillus polymyxa]MEE4565952.1 hypothetical protein [Paenibacillus polymyxa]